MLALCVGVPCRFFAAARAGLLWEEREPALFVSSSGETARDVNRLPSVFRHI